MILGALVDAGVPLESIRAPLESLPVSGWEIKATRTTRHGVSATKVDVLLDASARPPRTLAGFLALLEAGRLSDPVATRSATVFRRLAVAEGTVHGLAPEDVQFHALGVLDTVVDVVGSVAGFHLLNVDTLMASPLNLGSGTVETAHGRMPVPAPATAELLRGIPTYGSDVSGELVTPTGAALLSTLVHSWGPLPPLTIDTLGYGAGTRELPEQPNVLRLILGDSRDTLAHDQVSLLEANVDDMNPQLYEPLMDHLFAAGALDVFFSPVVMKKSRPATVITVLAPPPLTETVSDILFTETTTFGVRISPASRRKLHRESVSVTTPYGPIRITVGRAGEKILTLSPEFEDCRARAEEKGRPVKEVYDEARRCATEALSPRQTPPAQRTTQS